MSHMPSSSGASQRQNKTPRPKPTLRCTTLTTSSTSTLAASESGRSRHSFDSGIKFSDTALMTHSLQTQDSSIKDDGRSDFVSKITRVKINRVTELARIDGEPILHADQLTISMNPLQIE